MTPRGKGQAPGGTASARVRGRGRGGAFAAGLSVLLAAMGATWPALSQETGKDEGTCDAARRPWIRFEGGSLPAALGFPEIVRHVRAELERRDMLACVEGRGEPVAVVAFETNSETAVEVVVDVKDRVTRKRVSRVIDLRGTPRDARPLAVAVATDELLTASWAEIALESSPGAPPPREIAAAVSRKMKPQERRAEAGVGMAFDTYGGGQRFAGADMRGAYRALPRLSLTARLSLRRGLDVAAPHGTLGSAAWGAGAGLRVRIAELARALGVDAVGRVDVLAVSYSPEGGPGAIEHARQGTALVGTAGLSLRVEPLPAVRLGVEGLVGVPFRSVTATDSGGTVSGVSGLALSFAAEVVLAF